VSRALRVAVLGAGGIIAPAIVRDLAESDEAAELLLLDLDEERAEAAALAHGGPKASAQRVDARDGGLARALDGIDVLVNSASYRVNVHAMRSCLEAGCHYIDLGGLYHVTGQQLELHAQFADAGLLALLGMGSSPGKTNVMAVRAVRELGCEPERVDVIAAGRDLDPPDGPSFPYSPQTLVDELTMAPIAVRRGRAVALEPMGDGGEVDFGEPIGRGATIYTLHSEIRTFAESFGCTESSFRLSLPPAVLQRSRELMGASGEDIAAAAAAVPSSAHTVSVHVVEASGLTGAVRVTAVTEPMERWGLGGGIVSTAAPAAAAVRLIARGRIDARGAMAPERCVEPDDLFPELERRNCRFRVEEGVAR
jgi:saccharopine dehydrogenase-like NADP-dependent oxidoreductase